MEKDLNDNAMIVFSILTLIASTFVTSQRFKERSFQVKRCYEALGKLHDKVFKKELKDEDISEELEEYANILNECENHTEHDYLTTKCSLYFSTKAVDSLTAHPTFFDFINFAILKGKYYIIIVALYTLPFILLFISLK